MKKLNNHGLTAVEVLICFSITAVIVISLFKIINNFNEKQAIESKKNLIQTYKNTVTKTIQDDILAGGGVQEVICMNDDYDSGRVSVELKINQFYSSKITINFNGEEENDNIEEYIEYEYKAFDEVENKEKFTLKDIPGVEFNEPKIDYDEDNGLLNIYVGIIDLDLDLGDKYEVLDITLPLRCKWGNGELSCPDIKPCTN